MAVYRPIDRLRSLQFARYFLALALVAGLVTGNHFLAAQTVERERKRAEIINVAGKQRLLTQRVAYYLTQFASLESPDERAEAAIQMRKAAKALEAGHRYMTALSGSPLLAPATRNALKGIYFGPASAFDAQIERYLSRARSLLERPPDQISLSDAEVAYLQLIGSGQLVQTHDLVVSILETDSEEAIGRVQSLLRWLWAATILLLVAEALFIFRPLIRRVGKHMKDAAARSAATARAEAGSAVKSNILRNLSHELRTPLNIVLGHAMLLQHTDLNAEQRGMLGDVETAGRNLLDLINDMLELTRLVSGEFEMREKKTDTRHLLQGIIGRFEGPAVAKGLRLSLSVDPDVPKFFLTDPEATRQVLSNILSNAVKFTEAGSVEVGISKRRSAAGLPFLFLEVVDTGCGIPRERIGNVFHAFEQADDTLTRSHEGTGLGLALSRRLVELQGGRIGVESTEGTGSRFWFTLPLRKSDADGSEPGQAYIGEAI